MKRIYLHGPIGEGIPSSWELNVKHPAEAVRAININTDGKLSDNLIRFAQVQGQIGVVCLDERRKGLIDAAQDSEVFSPELMKEIFVPDGELYLRSDFDEIHFVPAIGGQFITAGLVAIGLSGMGLAVAQGLFMMVGSMLISGIANAMFPPVKVTNRQRKSKSYLFGDRPNLVRQGGPVPVGYGFLKVGSATLGFARENRFLPGSIGEETIESYTTFRIQDVISEGPIEGFCDSWGNLTWRSNLPNPNDNTLLNSIYINKMPVRNSVGDLNFMLNEGTVGTNTFEKPRFSLGNAEDKLFSHVEFEKNSGQSPLAGPDITISSFYPDGGDIIVNEHNYGRYAGGAPFTYALTDRNTGMLTLHISSEGMYHNWTDKRVRRRWTGTRVKVVQGTSPVAIKVAVRMFDGEKYIPPILPDKSYSLLEGLKSGHSATSKYYISNILTSKSWKFDEVVDANRLCELFVYAMFDDSRTFDDVAFINTLKIRPSGGVLNSKMIFKCIGSAQDFVSKFRSALAGEAQMYGEATSQPLSYYLGKYMDGNQRIDYSSSPTLIVGDDKISKGAELISSLYSQLFNTNISNSQLFQNNFHEVMQVVKMYSDLTRYTLGNDGHLYAVQEKLYKKIGGLTKKSRSVFAGLTAALKSGYTWRQEFGKYVKRGNDIIKTETEYHALTDQTGYSECGERRNREGILTIKGISTSPASIDFNVMAPYIGPGQSVTIQLLRLTREISDISEMSERSLRLSLKGIKHHKCLAGKLIDLSYPRTAWIETMFDSVNFQQVPERNYLVKLKKVAVPSNYNTRLRECIGAWNGLFKGQGENDGYKDINEGNLEWTENPAWVLFDILLNQRFGIGRHGMIVDNVDIWNLYAVAKFCDELVESGFPMEKPKRTFKTDNKSSLDGDSISYLKNKDRFLKSSHSGGGDSFFITIYDEAGDKLGLDSFLDEFNSGELLGLGGLGEVKVADCKSRGKYVAFFMSDGTLARRMVKNIDRTGEPIVELWGPSFHDHNSTSSSWETEGGCCLELSYPIVEPRFSMNTYFTESEEALDVIKEITASFRTVINYINGQISFVAEKPKEPSLMFTDANVSEQGFSYSGAPKSARLTAAKVRYIDKYDNFDSKVEYFEDAGGIDKFGYRDEEMIALGCTTRGQAMRLAKFMVLAPLLENEVVAFDTGMEGAMLLPGSIIEISDSRRFGENINGRVKSVDASQKSIDVDKIMSNLSFYDPVSGVESDRVEVCIMLGRGFEDIGRLKGDDGERTGLYKKMREMALDLDGFDADDQMSLISGIRRSQLAYFDGFLSTNRRKIENVFRKYKFSVNSDSNLILSEGHGLENGDKIKFLTFGVLPSVKDAEYVLKTDPSVVITAVAWAALPDTATANGTGRQDYSSRAAPLDPHSVYSVIVDEKQRHTFSIKAVDENGDPAGDVLDFSNKGYALSDESITGGEHFYYITKKVDGRDVTKDTLGRVMPGAVWSIKGYQREMFAESGKLKELLTDFMVSIGAQNVKNKAGLYYAEKLGTFLVSNFQYNSNSNISKDLLSIKQHGKSGLGLGNIVLSTRGDGTGYKDTGKMHMMGTLGETNILLDTANASAPEGNYIVAECDNGEKIAFYRPRTDTNILLDTTNTTPKGYYIINGISFTVRNRLDPNNTSKTQNFIRVGTGRAPSTVEIAVAYSDVSGVPELSTLDIPLGGVGNSIDVNDFRNVGRRQYRVNNVAEAEYGKYSIKASEYNRDKFEIIEKSLSLNRPTLPIPPQAPMDIPKAPSNPTIEDITHRKV